MMVTALRATVLFVAALPLAYGVFVVYSAWRFFRTRRLPVDDFTPGVSILKPVRGLDRASYENFATFCRQDYPDYEIVFAVADEDDPAIDVIRRLIASMPERSIRLLIGAPNLGPSSKVNKLCAWREARHDLLVINDSDIRLTPGICGPWLRLFRTRAWGRSRACMSGSPTDIWQATSRRSASPRILPPAFSWRGNSKA